MGTNVERDLARFRRLPQWAQKEIQDLERQVREHERNEKKLRGEHPDASSRVVVDPCTDQIPLPERETIRFSIGEHDWIDIHAIHKGDALVGVEVRGEGQLQVFPQVTNVIRVRPAPDRWEF